MLNSQHGSSRRSNISFVLPPTTYTVEAADVTLHRPPLPPWNDRHHPFWPHDEADIRCVVSRYSVVWWSSSSSQRKVSGLPFSFAKLLMVVVVAPISYDEEGIRHVTRWYFEYIHLIWIQYRLYSMWPPLLLPPACNSPLSWAASSSTHLELSVWVLRSSSHTPWHLLTPLSPRLWDRHGSQHHHLAAMMPRSITLVSKSLTCIVCY